MRLVATFLNALYPRSVTCDLCGRDAFLEAAGPGAFLCPACLQLLRPAPPLPPPARLEGLAAGLAYTEEAARLIHRFKYGGAQYLAETLAAFLPPPPGADCVVPVPLYPGRQRKRGYNQSELLARRLARDTGIPLERGLLARLRDTPSQTALHPGDRARNVRGAFRAQGSALGRRILLVDDVCTTGATLSECARVLRAAGAAGVWAMAACAVPCHTAGFPVCRPPADCW